MSDPSPLPDVFRLSCPICKLDVLVESLDRWGCSRCRGPVRVEPIAHPDVLRAFAAIRRHFGPVEVTDTDFALAFLYRETPTPFERLKDEFEAIGFLPFLRPFGTARLCQVVPRPRRKPMLLPRHVLLFSLTLATTLWVGYDSGLRMVSAGQASSAVGVAAAYAAALFLILGGHEMGHFVVARKTGTEASLPYFLPGPPPVGTFGAMISLRTPAPNRDAAILLAAAGPFAGFLLSIPVLWYGLSLSPVLGVAAAPGSRVFALGEPLLYRLLGAPSGLTTATIHPVGFAGFIGLFTTMLNLMPVGQLDGGQIARALLGGPGHRACSYVVLGVLFILGCAFWPGWTMLSFIGLILTLRGHPGSLDEVRPLKWQSLGVAVLALAVFALSFALAPFAEVR